MARTTYRTYLKSVGRKPINPEKLRTEKRPGDLEIIHVGGGEYRLHRYGEAA